MNDYISVGIFLIGELKLLNDEKEMFLFNNTYCPAYQDFFCAV